MQLLELALSEMPEHPTLIHPKTGDALRAIWQRADGSYKWPILGGADDDEDEDDEDDDTSGGGSEGEGTGSSEGTGSKEGEGDPEAKLRSDEAAKYRNKAKLARERAEKAEADLEQLRSKDLPELDKTMKERDEHKARAERLQGIVSEQAKRLAFTSIQGIDWADVDDALAVAGKQLRDVEIDDDGEIDRDEVARIAKEIAESKPHLLRTRVKKDESKSGGGEGDPSASSGSNGQTKGKRKAGVNGDERFTADQLKSQYPALRR